VEEGHACRFGAAHVQVDEVAHAKSEAVAVEAHARVVVVHGEHDVAEAEFRSRETRDGARR
jgi:hypothetical protein